MERGREFPQDHVAKDLGAVVVVLGGVLNKAEAVHVTHDAFSVGPNTFRRKKSRF